MNRWILTGLVLSGITLAAAVPAAPDADWPDSITPQVGDMSVRFERRSFWTLYRIDHEGERLCLDRWGSHYGSVAKFPGVGFIGSGHTENEDEVVEGLAFFVDDKAVPVPADVASARSVRLEKRSRIRTLQLHSVIDVRQDRIYETVEVAATEDTPLDLMYHFMHPWDPGMTDFLAETRDGTLIRGTFDNDKKQEVDVATPWSAVFDAKRRRGAVTVVLEAPADDWRTRYWDVPERYRKHYFTTFLNSTVPAGRTFRYRIVTVPFRADTDACEHPARTIAAEARQIYRTSGLAD